MIVGLFVTIWSFTFMKMTQYGMFSLSTAHRKKQAVAADNGTTSRYSGNTFNAMNATGMLLTPIGLLGTIISFLMPIAGPSMFPMFNMLINTSGPAGFVLMVITAYKTFSRDTCGSSTTFQCWTSSPTDSEAWDNGSYA